MVAAISRRFKDPDSHVADACVDAMGTLAEFAVRSRPGFNLGGGGSGGGGGKSIMAGPEALGGGGNRTGMFCACGERHVRYEYDSSTLCIIQQVSDWLLINQT
jgi:hypothetical protein